MSQHPFRGPAPPPKRHFSDPAANEGYVSGLSNDGFARGLHRFMLCCGHDEETGRNIRLWLDAFRLGQIDCGPPLGEQEWRDRFFAIAEAEKGWRQSDIESSPRVAELIDDGWLDGCVPEDCARRRLVLAPGFTPSVDLEAGVQLPGTHM